MNPYSTKLITFAEAAELLPADKNGKKLSAETIARWAWTGRRGFRLQSWKVGRQRFTSEAALMAFAEAIASYPDRNARRRMSAAVKRDREADRRLLDSLGL